MSTDGDCGGELVEKHLHDGSVESLADQTFGSPRRRAHGGEDVETFKSALFGSGRPGSGVGPDGGQGSFLTESGLVLEPDFDGFTGMGGRDFCDRLWRFFRNSSWMAGSA